MADTINNTINNAVNTNQNTADLTIATNTKDNPPESVLTLSDGTPSQVTQDSKQMSNTADAIDPYGQATISFEQGNYNQFITISQKIFEKQNLLTYTIIPLIEKALIELLGSNANYRAHEFIGSVDTNTNNIVTTATMSFKVESWIGFDVETEAIQKDAEYVYNTSST